TSDLDVPWPLEVLKEIINLRIASHVHKVRINRLGFDLGQRRTRCVRTTRARNHTRGFSATTDTSDDSHRSDGLGLVSFGLLTSPLDQVFHLVHNLRVNLSRLRSRGNGVFSVQ